MILLLPGCNSKIKTENEKLREQTIQLRQENETFQSQTQKQAASIENYRKLLNEINGNLKSIDLNATMVGKLGKDGSGEPEVRDQILARIETIRALMDNSRVKILSMDKSLRELRQKYGDQSEDVLLLNDEIKLQATSLLEKEFELAELTDNFDDLKLAYEQQAQLANELGEMLNRAYYYSGTTKTMVQKGIVDKEGGFIGLGRVKVLNANSDQQLFSQIRKDQTDTLVFPGNSIALITEHDQSGYKIIEENDRVQLIVTDKKAFWKTTNYLVIAVK